MNRWIILVFDKEIDQQENEIIFFIWVHGTLMHVDLWTLEFFRCIKCAHVSKTENKFVSIKSYHPSNENINALWLKSTHGEEFSYKKWVTCQFEKVNTPVKKQSRGKGSSLVFGRVSLLIKFRFFYFNELTHLTEPKILSNLSK